jgi:hypothetical protein
MIQHSESVSVRVRYNAIRHVIRMTFSEPPTVASDLVRLVSEVRQLHSKAQGIVICIHSGRGDMPVGGISSIQASGNIDVAQRLALLFRELDWKPTVANRSRSPQLVRAAARSPQPARKVARAVAKLRPEDRERYMEEWLADDAEIHGRVRRWCWSVGLRWSAYRLAKRPSGRTRIVGDT